MDRDSLTSTRKDFLKKTGDLVLSGFIVTVPAALLAQETDEKEQQESAPKKNEEPGVSPTEDLMREHGALARILLIYDDALARLARNQAFEPEVLASCANIIRRFVEDYHEKLEENHIFPRFEKTDKLVDLVKVLREQHQAGRKLTDGIMALTAQPELKKDETQRANLADSMRLFIRMYRPHKAREDTVLFPALHSIVSAHEFEAMGDEFERKEQQLFGKNGFENIVEEVASLEKKVEIYEISRFTPPV